MKHFELLLTFCLQQPSLDDALFEEVDVEDLRVSLFGGPVFRTDDREYRGVLNPGEFFKVLVFLDNGQLKAKAFLLTQNLDVLEVRP